MRLFLGYNGPINSILKELTMRSLHFFWGVAIVSAVTGFSQTLAVLKYEPAKAPSPVIPLAPSPTFAGGDFRVGRVSGSLADPEEETCPEKGSEAVRESGDRGEIGTFDL